MFNIQGGELIFLLLIALLVLGPEKLPDAIRKFGRAYSEFKKMANGFQGELKQVLDEPMRELRETAGMVREAADIDILGNKRESAATSTVDTSPPTRPAGTLNFGNAEARRAAPRDPEAADAPPSASAAAEAPKSTGMNFGDPSKRRRTVSDESEAVDATEVTEQADAG